MIITTFDTDEYLQDALKGTDDIQIGAEIAEQTDEWRWGLRVTPFMGLIAVLGIIFFMEDPPRGSADGSDLRPSSPREDLNALRKNTSFVLSTVAFTCVTFSAGKSNW